MQAVADAAHRGLASGRYARPAIAALLCLTYALLIPGLVFPHLHYEERWKPQWWAPTVHYETATGILHMVHRLFIRGGLQYVSVAIFLLIWGVGLPATKLTILVLYMSGLTRSRKGVEIVCTFSKWALIDGLVPTVWVGLLGGAQQGGLHKVESSTTLEAGYYFFMSHCILAQIVHHCILELWEQDEARLPLTGPPPEARGAGRGAEELLAERGEGAKDEGGRWRLLARAGAALQLALLVLAIVVPTLTFEHSFLRISENLSILQLNFTLLRQGFWLPTAIIGVVVVAAPTVDFALGLAEAGGLRVAPRYRLVVDSFSMFDVFMMGLVLSVIICPVMFTDIAYMSLSPAGWVATISAMSWGLYRLCTTLNRKMA